MTNEGSQESYNLYVTPQCIQSKLHDIYSIVQTKMALNPNDEKRYLVSGTYETFSGDENKLKTSFIYL